MFGILCLGDSIVFGRGEKPATGWIGRIKNDFEKKAFNRCLFNLGYPGETTKSIKNRFKIEIENRIRNPDLKDKFIIMIGLGINDSRALDSPDNVEVSLDLYKKNISDLVKIAKKFKSEVILLGLTPIDENRVCPFNNLYFSNSRISEYNNILMEISSKEQIYYIDFLNKMKIINNLEISGDGLHPNSKGYEIMYGIIKEFLEKNKLVDF